MRCVTVLLTGVPHFVSLQDLSQYLDFLFNTDDIGSFRSRSLPVHPRTNQRQIALDFHSGFDAMAAQEKLDGYKYELYDGNLYTLSAKINKRKDYMRHDSFSPDRSMQDHHLEWSAMGVLPDLSYGELTSANSKLDAKLELLKKQKLILEAERELLIEKKKLKREYNCMHAPEDADTSFEDAAPKRLRSSSSLSESQPGPSRGYSSSRGLGSMECRSRSRSDTRVPLSKVDWDESLRTRELRSHTKERRSTSRVTHSRDLCSTSRGPSDLRSLICSKKSRSKSRERRSISNDVTRRIMTHRDPSSSSSSPERIYRARRSTSRERNYRKRRSTSRDSRSRERSYRKRISTSRENGSRERNYRKRRSTSRESRSRERNYRKLRSTSRERSYRCSSRERDRRFTSLERDRKRRSRPREKNNRAHRSFSRDRVHKDRRSASRPCHGERTSRSRERCVRRKERTRFDEVGILSSSSRDIVVPRSMTPDTPLIANMSTCTEQSETLRAGSLDTNENSESLFQLLTENSTIFREKVASKNIINNATVKNKKTISVPEKNTKDSDTINGTGGNQSVDKNINHKENQEKKALTKFNTIIRKNDNLEKKVESIARDVMFLMLILLEEILIKQNIKISNSNKLSLEKTLHQLTKERVEPLVRERRNTDFDVLLKYKLKYPKENDILMLKKMLDDIPKTNESKASTNIAKNAASLKVVDGSTKQQEHNAKGYHAGQNKDNELQETKFSGSNSTNTVAKKKSVHPESVKISKTLDYSRFLDITDLHSNVPEECNKKQEENANNLTQSENKDNLLRIKELINKHNEAIVTIDIDSPAKPVPKRPQFFLVIKSLLKDMMKVIRVMKNNNSSDHIHSSDLQHVLRYILTKLMKGQAYKPKNEIINIFRALYPKEKDAQFIKDVIEDIKDGKYPGLTGPPATSAPSEDDVILIENKYEVITLVDSDDDDLIEVKKEVNRDVDCKTTPPSAKETYPANPGSELTGRADLGTANTIFELLGLAQNNPTDLIPSKPGTSMHVRVRPGAGNLDSTEVLRPNPGLSGFTQVNPDPANVGPNNLTPAKPISKPGPVHPGSVNNYSIKFRLTKPGTSKLVAANPDTSKLRLVNPGSANSSPSNLAQINPNPANFGPAKLTPAKPMPGSVHSVSHISGAIGFRTTNPGTSNLVLANPVTSKVRLINPESANPRPTFLRPVNPGSPNLRPVNHGPVNRPTKLKPVYPDISNIRPVDPDPINYRVTNLRPVDHGISKFLPASLRPIELRPANAGTSKIGSVNSRLANTGVAKTGMQAMKKTGSQTQPRVTANTDEEDLKNKCNENDAKTEMANAENAKDQDAIERIEESNSNSLKVTAITVMTSLNELSAITDKTTEVGPTMEVPIESIKEEIPFENSDTEQPLKTAPNQNCHVTSSTEMPNIENAKGNPIRRTKRIEDNNSNNLKVTAITIMTSLSELSAIANNDGSRTEPPMEDIKEEIQFENSDTEQIDSPLKHYETKVIEETVHCDKETAKPNNSVVVNKDQISNSCVNGEQQRALRKQGNGSGQTTNEKETLPRNCSASDDEDETIESILKYLQSMI